MTQLGPIRENEKLASDGDSIITNKNDKLGRGGCRLAVDQTITGSIPATSNSFMRVYQIKMVRCQYNQKRGIQLSPLGTLALYDFRAMSVLIIIAYKSLKTA